MRSRIALLLTIGLVAGLLPFARVSVAQEAPEPTLAADRGTEAVVLTGTNFPTWAALADVALEAPHVDAKQCLAGQEAECTHNTYEDPDFQSSDYVPAANAAPVDRLLGYRWNGESFEQIPFQVDEMFTRYLSNNNSGFAFYSETDQHNSYAFDREGFRWQDSDPDNACLAQPSSEVAKDPVQGLDTDDELVFMARDAGAQAPEEAALPAGIEGSYEVVVGDPANQTSSFVYVMKAAEEGPEAAFNKDNGYVRYERDADSNVFLFSESSYDNYGAAPKGPWYDPETGICRSAESEWKQHRPGDQATISTPRYQFRYEGRWLMTELRISQDQDGDWKYGDDVIDQWKARAFQQRPGGETPCCGYEEEVNNWGGSSILMGERSGPVRTIRETWGADSGTNVVRREIFYRDEIRFISFLRVHVIPPGDGIYAQWDYNAGIMTRYYNQFRTEGVAIDGQNDEVFGNSRVHVGRDGVSYEGDDTISDEVEEANGGPVTVGNPNEPECDYEGRPLEDEYDEFKERFPDSMKEQMPGDLVDLCVYNDIDSPDPTFSGINAGLNYEQVSGPGGTLVMRTQIKQATPGGTAQSLFAVPYYRDDSCFDDGTGSNPGPHLNPRDTDDGEFAQNNGVDRRCWTPADGTPPPEGDPQFWQGSIGTHGVHILLIADSDNAGTTVPLTEIDSDQRMVVLPTTFDNVGERFGRQTEKPLVAVAHPEDRGEATEPTETPTESPSATPSATATPTPVKSSTSLTFTDNSDTGGQFSDVATFEAKLTDKTSGNAISGAEVTFELSGADGTSSFTATTKDNGIATTDVTLDRTPGSYQLVARYDGDNDRLGSADQSGFAIDREDTDLTLTINGNGSKRTLTAKLTDRDSGVGLAGRKVQFFEDGQAIATATTNGDGVATAPAKPGKRTFEARFDGDSHYVASSAQQRG